MANVKSEHRPYLLHHAAAAAQERRRAAGGHAQGRRRAAASRLPRLWHFAAEYLLLLPLGAAAALVWVNVAPESYFRVAFSLDFIVNDVAMVVFFGLLMKEVAEATAPGGVLHSWRRAAVPLVASVGLTVLPAIVFVLLVPVFDEPRLREGWPVLFATDLAAGYFVARMIFGRHPAIPFFVLLAICANGLGILALAASGATGGVRFDILAVGMTAALGMAYAFRMMRVKSFWPYVAAAGSVSWCAMYLGGFQPALALVPIVPFIPHARRDPGFFVDAAPGAHDALSRFEVWSRHPAQAALLLFGIVNAGVPFAALYWGTWSLPVAAVIAKPAGLLGGVALALALGLRLPDRIGWRELVVLGFVASTAFTMALFFATAAVGPGPTLSALKMGALLSIGAAVLAYGAARVLRTGRFAH
jgi:NhaA family Na+:H+ antiporter